MGFIEDMLRERTWNPTRKRRFEEMLRRNSRDIREAQAARPRFRSNEDSVIKEKGTTGIDEAPVMYGLTANKPTADYLLARGVGSMVYIDTEAATLYAWDGLAWKSVALS
jgi:hypothetical protein